MPEIEAKWAHTVLAENLKVRKGENVLIESWTHALPYARAFVREVRRLGARPTVLYEDENAWWDAVSKKQFGQFRDLSATERAALESADVFVHFWGPEDRPRAQGLPDKEQEKLIGFNEEWYKIARKSGVRGARLTVGQATDPMARMWGLKGNEWRARLMKAGQVNAPSLLAKGRKVERTLGRGSTLRIRHSNGTDLTVRLRGVHTRTDAGLLDAAAMKRPYGMLANNPSGQVFVAIDRSDAAGTFVSNRAIYLGADKFDGQRWTFTDGHLTDHAGGSGNDVFEKQYRDAPKGRDRLGYLSIGLNPESRELPPCEDTEAGAVLIGIGANGFAGGKVRIPFLGYAMIGDATVEVDGRAIARGGRIL